MSMIMKYECKLFDAIILRLCNNMSWNNEVLL